MSIRLADAMPAMLQGWQNDLDAAWKLILGGVELGFTDIDENLLLEYHEPIFPARKSQRQLGAAKHAHMFRAFDDLQPKDVRCVLLGQDPYPCMAFSTGRAFDCGSYSCWRDFDDLFTHSMRCFTQCIYAERAGKPEMAGSIAKWDETLRSIEAREISLETPKAIAQGWVDQGVLLLNSSLTISRFSAQGDPHQVRGHLPLWRPLIVRVLQHLSNESERTVPIVLFGDVAKATFRAAEPGFDRNLANPLIVIETEHPAAGDAFLLNGNPLTHCNEHLRALGEQPIRW